MARMGRSFPTLAARGPSRPLVVSDDFPASGLSAAWVQRSSTGATDPAGAGYYSTSSWAITQNLIPITSDDFEIEYVLGQMSVGTPNSNIDSAGVSLTDTSGNGFMCRTNTGSLDLNTTNGWTAGTNWGLRASSSTAIGFTQGDRIALRRTGNVYTTYKNGVAIPGASWVDAANITSLGPNNRLLSVLTFRWTANECRYIDSVMARGLVKKPSSS